MATLGRPLVKHNSIRRLTMVTTNSLTPDLNFSVEGLLETSLLEDLEIVNIATARINEMVQAILPILTYIAVIDSGVKGIMLCNQSLMIDVEGKWYFYQDSAWRQSDNAWHRCVLGMVFGGLEEAFELASKKRQEHLGAVNKRKEMLNKIGAIIRGEKPATEQK